MMTTVKGYFKFIIVTFGLFGFGNFYHGQAQQGWMLGAAPSSEIDNSIFGANARLYFGVNDHFCFGPEITLFPYQEIDDENELKILDLNLNAHYIFELTHKLGVYPLTGVNYTEEKERLVALQEEEEEEKENGLGLNYGFGAHYNLHNLYVFAEFKGVAGKLSAEFVTVGVILPLLKSPLKKDHTE
ncbi:outer membrane beta-barrel protein [Spongiimicrobium sp. 3-5]|uniref:outer membrane beta-barrel protein n=1 Tax=Spongiimicrobium sp. 3-5 TaxID=3332596 RepID=UPI00397F11F4